MSTLTAFDYIPERSQATPGLFNRMFSTLSDNIRAANDNTASLNTTITLGSGNTLSIFTNIDVARHVKADLLSIGSTPTSTVTNAHTIIAAHSGGSDYIQFQDSSAARSNYIIGSHAGGTADGLNIYDLSGDTILVGFSKQSTKFYSPVVGTFFDLGGTIFNVKSFGAVGNGVADDTQSIQDAVNFANGRVVYLPAGTYRITSAISRVIRSYNTNVPGLKIFGDGMHATVIDSRVTNGFAIVLDSTFTRAFQWGGFIRDLSITPLSSTSTSGGIYITSAWELAIERVRLASLTTTAIYVPLRDDLSLDVDDYTTYYTTIANNVIELNTGWGIFGAGGVAFNTTIDANQIGSNQGGGVYLAGHHCRVIGNSIFGNGFGGTANVHGGLFVDTVQAGPAGLKVHSNEFDSDNSYSIRVSGLAGGEISNNRFISVTSGVSMLPPVGVTFVLCSEVMTRGNHVRTGSANTRPYTAFDLPSGNVNNFLFNNLMSSGDNTSGLTKYVNSGASNLIIEQGSFQSGFGIIAGDIISTAGDHYFTASGRGIWFGAGGASAYVIANPSPTGLRLSGLNGTELRLSGNTLMPATVDAVGLRGFSRTLLGDGTVLAPSRTFSSESSLGHYRFGAATIAQSTGTFNLASNSVRLSVRTAASLDSTTLAVDEVAFSLNASGASLALKSGGTVWYFASSASTKG